MNPKENGNRNRVALILTDCVYLPGYRVELYPDEEAAAAASFRYRESLWKSYGKGDFENEKLSSPLLDEEIYRREYMLDVCFSDMIDVDNPNDFDEANEEPRTLRYFLDAVGDRFFPELERYFESKSKNLYVLIEILDWLFYRRRDLERGRRFMNLAISSGICYEYIGVLALLYRAFAPRFPLDV